MGLSKLQLKKKKKKVHYKNDSKKFIFGINTNAQKHDIWFIIRVNEGRSVGNIFVQHE